MNAILHGVTFAFVYVPLSAASIGLALPLLWGWFVVPLGVAPLGFWHAIGLALVVSFFRWKSRTRAERDEPPAETHRRFWDGILAQWLIVGLGWIVVSVQP